MAEVWLRANTRILLASMVAPALCAMLGIALLVHANGGRLWAAVGGGLLLLTGLPTLAGLVWLAGRPRLACDGRHLLVYLRLGRPLRVPLELVEAFLLGRGPGLLPWRRLANAETASVIIRIAEKAASWAQVDVEPILGAWCQHYVTVRGTWTEPLSVDVVNRLNARLADAQRRLRAQSNASVNR